MSAQCRAAALRYLKIRPRSVYELRQKLVLKKFDVLDIDETLHYLESIQMLDDRAFTVSWINYRLARPFGFSRIIRELKDKGIAPALIHELIDEAKESADVDEVIADLVVRKAQRLDKLDPQKKKKRIFDFLMRRGFPADLVMKAIKKLC